MKKAGDLLSAFLDESVMKKARDYSVFFSSWEKMTRDADIPAAAAHSRIAELERHIILVEADHPGWIQILQTRQSELLRAAQRLFPALLLSGISIRLCRDPASFAAPPKAAREAGRDDDAAEKPDLPDTEPNESRDDSAAKISVPDGNDPYAGIKDENFKETLQRLEKSILKRGKK